MRIRFEKSFLVGGISVLLKFVYAGYKPYICL